MEFEGTADGLSKLKSSFGSIKTLEFTVFFELDIKVGTQSFNESKYFTE